MAKQEEGKKQGLTRRDFTLGVPIVAAAGLAAAKFASGLRKVPESKNKRANTTAPKPAKPQYVKLRGREAFEYCLGRVLQHEGHGRWENALVILPQLQANRTLKNIKPKDKVDSRIAKQFKAYCDHPRDPGKATNFGITQATYSKWRKDNRLKDRHVILISEKEIRDIYRDEYWLKQGVGRVANVCTGLALLYFDACVNQGIRGGPKTLQNALNARGAKLKVDGSFGDKTYVALLAQKDYGKLVMAHIRERQDRYSKTKNRRIFGNTWNDRLANIAAESIAMANPYYGWYVLREHSKKNGFVSAISGKKDLKGVSLVQALLNESGVTSDSPLKIDGMYGNGTNSGVSKLLKRFRKKGNPAVVNRAVLNCLQVACQIECSKRGLPGAKKTNKS